MRLFFVAFVLLAFSGCAPAVVPMAQALAPRLPGMNHSQHVMLEGERVYYESGGSGSPVVLVHGIGAGNSSHLWQNNTAALAKTHRVYAFDFPGFARSGARATRYTNDLYAGVLEQFLRQVVKGPASLIGGSLGADYAIRVAAEHPELVSSLIVSNPSGYDPSLNFAREQSKDQDLYNLFANTLVGNLTFSVLNNQAGINYFLYNFVYLDQSRVTPALTQVFLENLDGPDKQYAPFSFFSGFLDQPVKAFWPKLKQPTMLVWGSDDRFTSIDYAQEFLKDRSVPFHVLKARAIPYDEDFETFNALAVDFLK